MKSKAQFREVEKFCPCGKKLLLNNTRDIERKKFCSQKCNAIVLLNKLWTED